MITYICITVLSLMTAFVMIGVDTRRTPFPLMRKVEWFVRSFALWGLIAFALSALSLLCTYTANGREIFMHTLQSGLTVFMPFGAASIAMYVVRRPTSRRVMRREMELNGNSRR